MAAWLGIG